tara:strand:+ start:297 stop:449 length:153 start_codon:yes stop_codon:yes gene_type:complete
MANYIINIDNSLREDNINSAYKNIIIINLQDIKKQKENAAKIIQNRFNKK